MLDLDALAVLATPILVFDRMVGVFGLHRSEPRPWPEAEISLAEAVSREVAIAFHAAQLFQENKQRLEQQAALLTAAQVVTSELRLETVLQRLVVEVTKLLDADAADCYLYDDEHSVLRCAAVYGLDDELVAFEFPADRESARPVRRARPAPGLRGVRERDRGSDDLVRRAPRRARRRDERPEPAVRQGRVEPPGDIRAARPRLPSGTRRASSRACARRASSEGSTGSPRRSPSRSRRPRLSTPSRMLRTRRSAAPSRPS